MSDAAGTQQAGHAHPLRRRLEEGLEAVRDHVLRASQRSKLCRQLAKLVGARRAARRIQSKRDGCRQARTRTSETPRTGEAGDSGTGTTRDTAQNRGSGSSAVGRAARGPAGADLPTARFQISRVTLECNLWNTTSAETNLGLRAMNLLRLRKTVKMSWWGRPSACW